MIFRIDLAIAMGAKSVTPVPPSHKSRGPVLWGVLALAAICFWFASSSPGGAQQVQLGGSLSLRSTAAGMPFCTSAEAAAQAKKLQAALAREGLYAACPDHKWLGQLPGVCGMGWNAVVLLKAA
jgi:hypothetical protein